MVGWSYDSVPRGESEGVCGEGTGGGEEDVDGADRRGLGLRRGGGSTRRRGAEDG